MSDHVSAHADQRYIQGLLDHDEKLVAEIYRICADKVKRWVCQNSGTADDAADIFQEALMSLYHQARARQLRLSCPFEAFFLLVCKRMWLNELKKRSRQGVTISTDTVFDIGEDDRKNAEALLDMHERDALVKAGFDMLGARCREVIQVSLTGRHQEELAAQLGVSYGYLRKKKSECMAQLIRIVSDLRLKTIQ